jgi:hypothetical protein
MHIEPCQSLFQVPKVREGGREGGREGHGLGGLRNDQSQTKTPRSKEHVFSPHYFLRYHMPQAKCPRATWLGRVIYHDQIKHLDEKKICLFFSQYFLMFTKVLHVSRKVFFCGDFFYLTKNI